MAYSFSNYAYIMLRLQVRQYFQNVKKIAFYSSRHIQCTCIIITYNFGFDIITNLHSRIWYCSIFKFSIGVCWFEDIRVGYKCI